MALPDQNVGSNTSLTADPDNFVSGTDIFFKLGNIVNNDSDVNDETITIEFNALIDNNAGGSSNDRGENRDNSFDYTFTGASSLLTSNSSRVRIVEAGLSSSKSVAPASADAGDTVTYTIVITNGTGADFTDAFDVVASDILPSELGNIAVQTPILTGAASGANASVSGQTVRLSVDRMPPGSTVTLQYTASLITNVSSGQQIINTVTSTYTSLPGTNGTPHGQPGNATGSSNNGLPGAVTGERIGTSPITAPNDLVTSANAQVTVFVPDPQKSMVSTSEADSSAASVVIGEIVRYRMLVRLAEGVSPDVQLRDNLPPGMQLLLDGSTRFAIVSNGPGISSSDAEINSCADVPVLPPMGAILPCALSNAHIATGPSPIFMLGSITNNDTDADQEYILIEFNAMVENIGTNNLGTALPNTFNVLIGAQDRGLSTPVTVTVAEPVITNLSKTLIASSPLAVNSTVDYRLSFTNTGTAPAYDLLLTDTLHVSLGSPTMLIDSIPPYASADTSASSGNTAVIRITTLRPGDSIQITLRTTIQTLPSPGTILNQVELSYSSLSGNNGTTNNPTGSVNTGIPGSPTGERTGILADPINDLRDIDTEAMPLGRIGDRIWFDINGDGQQNTGEPGLENINVTIGGPGQDGIAGTPDDVNASTQTNSSGNYLFEGLLPGSYTISIDTNSLPAGMTISGDPDAGTLSSSISLTLGNAESRDTIDFGYTGTASLGDYVWLDQNGDGVQDIAEEGLANVMVTAVWPGPDGDINSVADNLSYSTATDANGLYNFTRLPAAVYTLSVSSASLPGGVRQSYDLDGLASANTTQITLPAQTAITTADFGYQGTAGLGDYVWYDLDGDGIADSTERGIPGVTLSAIWYGPDNTPATADDIAFTTTTDVDGAYAIRGLPAGNYSISTSTLPPGAQPSYDADGTATPHTATISLSALAFTTTLDFGYTGTLTIGDHVWFDKDNDGIDDGIGNSEIGLPNITVILTYYGPDGLLGGGDDVNISTQTDRDGNYSFPDLLAGGYTISVDASSLPAGLTLSADPDAGTLSESFDTSLSTSTLTVDFGYTGTGSLGDRIWLDQDGDGLQDATELGIAGVLVTLEWAGPDNDLNTSVDNVSYTTSTDAAGNYLIGDLPFGSYQVLIDDSLLPAGLTPSYDLDGTATAHSSLTTLDAANPSRTSLDFGYQGNAAIGDRVWFDTNGDGLQDSGEPGMGGIVVILTWYGSDGVAGGGDDQQRRLGPGLRPYLCEKRPGRSAGSGLDIQRLGRPAGRAVFSVGP